MKTLKRGIRWWLHKFVPKVFNLIVIFGLVLQPVGPAGVYSLVLAQSEEPVTPAVEEPAPTPDPVEEEAAPAEEPAEEPAPATEPVVEETPAVTPPPGRASSRGNPDRDSY